RNPQAHHTKDSIYSRRPDWEEERKANPVTAMTIELPGNFGGKSYTNQILHWARMMMGQTIMAFSAAKIFNCSDGASIPGTFPKLAQAIRVPDLKVRKAVTLSRLKHEVDPKRPGEMATTERIKTLRDAFQQYYAMLREEVTCAIEENIDFITFYDRLYG